MFSCLQSNSFNRNSSISNNINYFIANYILKQNIIQLIILQMSDDQIAIKIMMQYFRKPKNFEEDLEKLLKIAEIYAKKGQQSKFVKSIFDTMKAVSKIENFKMMMARILKIIHDLLQRDESKQDNLKYGKGVSDNLIEIYTYIFQKVFKYELHDTIIALKTFRMKWAKRITDHCFDMLRNELLRIHNFDLNKGFPQDIIDKIVKRYRKRGFKQFQIFRYMPQAKKLQKNQTTTENQLNEFRKRQRDQSIQKSTPQRSPSYERRPQKYLKTDEPFYNTNEIPSNGYPYYQNSYYPPYDPSNRNSYLTQPPIYNGYHYPPHFQQGPGQNFGPSYPYYPSEGGNPYPLPSQNRHPGYYNPSVSPIIKNQDPRQRSNSSQNYQSSTASYQKQQQFNYCQVDKVIQPTRRVKHHQLLNKIFQGTRQCKQCGMHVETLSGYQNHTQDHFRKAKEQFDISHRKDGYKRQYLKDKDLWIQEEKVDTSLFSFKVPVANTNKNQCIFCNNKFVEGWSNDMNAWVYEDAIQTLVVNENWIGKTSQKNLAHFQCFETFQKQSSTSN